MTTVDVREARSILGLTQEQFARRLRVSVRSVKNWEADATAPLPIYAAKIQRAVRRAQRASEITGETR